MKIKEGSWVRVNNSRPLQFKCFTKNNPSWNKSLDYENIEMLCGERFHIPKFDRSIVTLWKPQEGEYCWFWDEDTLKLPYFTKLLRIDNEDSLEDDVFLTSGEFSDEIFTWDCCEPFIGQLPNKIKDLK